MPRISLYKDERGVDYKFIDRQISEMFAIAGVTIYLHKYLGAKPPSSSTADQPTYDTIDPTNIQDLLFLENRDRKYESEIYRLRGKYEVQNIDFNVSQFGLFIDNDTLFLTVHINDFITHVGRKPISGDVIELPNLRDEFAMNEYDVSLPRYYSIQDVGRASEGFSATWYPHLYRLRLKKITANQQFADITNTPVGEDADLFLGEYMEGELYYPGQIVRYGGLLYQVRNTVPSTGTSIAPPNQTVWSLYSGVTLDTLLSTREKELQINDALLLQAETDSPKSGYETRQYFTLAVDEFGKPVLILGENNTIVNATPIRSGYTGYLLGDGFPPNGHMFGHGIQFPDNPRMNDFFLRTDFLPTRLYRFDGSSWIKWNDNVRMTLSNINSRMTLRTSFINNTTYTYMDETGFDAITLQENTTIIDTNIVYHIPKYVNFRLENIHLDYSLEEFPELIVPYIQNDVEKIRIMLPSYAQEQDKIPATGVWMVGTYADRIAERQALSKVQRPVGKLSPMTHFVYKEPLASTEIELTQGTISIQTPMPYKRAPFIVLRNGNTQLDYATIDYPVIQMYQDNNIAKILINLPMINGVQNAIPYSGTWFIGLYKRREEQLPGASTLITSRPAADL